MMANYLSVCLDAPGRFWLNSLPERSIGSWGELVKQFINDFQATCEKPDSHFDLTQIKQRPDEPLRDYIKRFCTKKTTIPRVPDQQVISAFQAGLKSDGLVHEIERRNHKLELTAAECFRIADTYASGESAARHIRDKGKDRRQEADEPSDPKGKGKRKADNLVASVRQGDRPTSFKKGQKRT